MSQFHFMHVIPHPRKHGLQGYLEVIQALQWGLRALGHEATYAVNEIRPGAVNIVFGAQVMETADLEALPPDTICCNFEQLRGLKAPEVRPEMHVMARRFAIWEYSGANIDGWRMLGASRVALVPVGYAPVLSRIPKPQVQDIEVLIYGVTGPKRLNAFHRLAHAGLTIVYACGLYGEARDALIARSKIILNINHYDAARIFEVVRVSYLLANRKAVVAVSEPGTSIEADIAASVQFSAFDDLAEVCTRLVKDDARRAALEEAGFEAFRRRDIVPYLRAALA